MAQAVALFIAPAKRGPMREVSEIRAIADKGFDGCVHGRPGSKRQVLLMDSETLAEFSLAPGIVRENITTRGLRLAELHAGQRFRIGDALLEVTGPCDPCERMDEIRMGLREALKGRRGILCRVVEPGLIRRDAEISCLAPAEAPEITGGNT